MNDQTPEGRPQRARIYHSGSGAQHLPAHSIALRSSTKARDSKLAAHNLRQEHISTPIIRHFQRVLLTAGTKHPFKGSENSVKVRRARR